MKEEAFLKDDNIIPLEVTSQYNSLLDTNIRFYNSDIGTSVLNFMVTKNNNPFEISLNNAKATIDLKTENYGAETGAHISDDLNIIDPFNGRLSYTLPYEFLKYNGKVKGQVFFTQNGSNNTIVMREFSFTIDNDQISDFDGVTKLTYIKTLKDEMAIFKDDISKFKKVLGDAPSIVNGIEQKVNQGIRNIESKLNEVVEELNNEIINKQEIFENDKNVFIKEVQDYQEELVYEFNKIKQDVKKSGLLTNEDVSNFQKSKITTDTGLAESYSDVSIQTILNEVKTTKIVHVNNATDAPSHKPIDTSDLTDENQENNTRVDDEFNEVDEEIDDLSSPQIQKTYDSGILIVYKSENSGRAIWYPDDNNEIYTCYVKDDIWLSWFKINDESITKDFIESLINSKTSEHKEFIENHFNSIQKHKITDSVGQTINVNFDFAQSTLVKQKTGNYYGVNLPNLPIGIESTEGYLRVTSKDNANKLFEFTPKGTTKNLIRTLNDSNLSDWSTFNEERKKLLFDGSVNSVGSDIVLTDDFTKYEFLIVSGIYPGGTFNEVSLTSMEGSIIVTKNNIVDSTGDGGAAYEAVITKVDNRTLRIANDVFWDLGLRKASGANANKITVKKVMGWK